MTKLFNEQAEGEAEAIDVEAVKQRFSRDGQVDVEELLKAKAHADAHIKRVEAEAAAARQDAERRATYDKVLEAIEKGRQSPSVSNLQPQDEDEQEDRNVTEAMLDAKVDAILTKKQQAQTQAQNIALVNNELAKAWGGNNITSTFKRKAAELGFSEQYLEDMAKQNPRGFLNVVLGPTQVRNDPNSFTAPASSVRTVSSSATTKNYKYFADQIAKNPKLQYDKDFVDQMHTAAKATGESFYN